MPACPTCHQAIEPQAIACPYCRTPLKAFGHPGIPLHRSTVGYLCDSCVYHQDDSCNFPKRPTAKDCTLYVDLAAPLPSGDRQRLGAIAVDRWLRRNSTWLLLTGFLLVCLVLVMRQS